MKSRIHALLLLFVSAAASTSAHACSEATDGLIPPDEVDAVGPVQDGGRSSASGSSSGGSRTPAEAGSTATSSVVINEISAGDDWVELVNTGAAPVDISGWIVADSEKDTGKPKVSEGATFPEGTSLAPGAFAIVKAGGLDAGKPCSGTDLAACVHAEFGISQSGGETIFLLKRDESIAGSVVFPANGQDSWGRVPSGDPRGTFLTTAPSPGGPNPAP